MFILMVKSRGFELSFALEFSGNLFMAFANYILSGLALLYLAQQGLKKIINFILLQENLEKEFPGWGSLR
jgi:hypothetical protein